MSESETARKPGSGSQTTPEQQAWFGFPKSMHLRKRSDFDRVFQRKYSVGDGVLVIYGAANHLGVPRLGLVVSKKVGKAPQRNRWKRLIREVFRLEQQTLPEIDLVIIPRQGFEPDFDTIRRSFCKLMARIASPVSQGKVRR